MYGAADRCLATSAVAFKFQESTPSRLPPHPERGTRLYFLPLSVKALAL